MNILQSLTGYNYTQVAKPLYNKPNVSLDLLDKPEVIWQNSEKPDRGFKLLSTVAPNGMHPWYYLKNAGAKKSVGVIPIVKKDGEDHILFIRQLRPPLYAERKAADSIEIPAGFVETSIGETDEQAAIREAEEETGFKAKNVKLIARNINEAPNVTDEIISIATVEVDVNQKADLDPNNNDVGDNGAIVSKHLVPVSNVQNWLVEQAKLGASINAMSCTGLYFLTPEYPELTNINQTANKTGSRFDYII